MKQALLIIADTFEAGKTRKKPKKLQFTKGMMDTYVVVSTFLVSRGLFIARLGWQMKLYITQRCCVFTRNAESVCVKNEVMDQVSLLIL